MYITPGIVGQVGKPAGAVFASPARRECTGRLPTACANCAPRASSPTTSARPTAPPARGTTRREGSAAGRILTVTITGTIITATTIITTAAIAAAGAETAANPTQS